MEKRKKMMAKMPCMSPMMELKMEKMGKQAGSTLPTTPARSGPNGYDKLSVTRFLEVDSGRGGTPARIGEGKLH